jgi:hypothetical protein
MGLLVYKVADYSYTAEREQYRTICELLKKHYSDKEEMCLFVANYNIYDSEIDGILFKNDAVISIEFKNYGGEVTAVENGCWTLADGTIIKGGSRKNPYQQAKVNHINLKQGLSDGMILSERMLRNVPALIVFNQPIICNNQLSGRVKSWLHITDNDHFLQKVADITESHTDLSNEEIINLVEKLNLQEEWRDHDYSDQILSEDQSPDSEDVQTSALPFEVPASETKDTASVEETQPESGNTHFLDESKIRVSSDYIETLAENEIFVFGSNLAGKHIGGAARQAYQKFGAAWGVGSGPTGKCYAIPTMHGGLEVVAPHIEEFIKYAKEHPELRFLVTKVGCGVAKFHPNQIAPLFSPAAELPNVFLPAEFWLHIKH